jgi:hypothetical protein
MSTEDCRSLDQTARPVRNSEHAATCFSNGEDERPVDPVMDVLCDGRNRIQNTRKAAANPPIGLAFLWGCQFAAGMFVGLLCVFTTVWLLIRIF